MTAFNVCPKCGSIGIKVPFITIKNHVKKDFQLSNGEWFCCGGSNCKVAYFSNNMIIYVQNLKTKLWYKSKDMDAPICYCANITRGELHTAIDNGCTTIKEVRSFLDKHHSGECELKNPLGGCCHKAFQKEITEYQNEGF